MDAASRVPARAGECRSSMDSVSYPGCEASLRDDGRREGRSDFRRRRVIIDVERIVRKVETDTRRQSSEDSLGDVLGAWRSWEFHGVQSSGEYWL